MSLAKKIFSLIVFLVLVITGINFVGIRSITSDNLQSYYLQEVMRDLLEIRMHAYDHFSQDDPESMSQLEKNIKEHQSKIFEMIKNFSNKRDQVEVKQFQKELNAYIKKLQTTLDMSRSYLKEDAFRREGVEGTHSFKATEKILDQLISRYSISDQQELKRKIMYLSVLSLSFGLMVSLLVYALFQHILVKPLQHVSDVSQKIATGDYSQRIMISKGDEIGKMAENFNHMTEKIQYHVTLLQKQMTDLEEAHKAVEAETLAKVHLEKLNKELKKIDLIKDQFLAMISHELRTPLVSIIGYAEMILDCEVKEKDKDRFVNIIVDEASRLSELIDQILDFSAISDGKLNLNLSTVLLKSTITKSVEAVQGLTMDRGIKIETSLPDLEFVGDADRIIQVLINLLGNAIKFSPDGGIIQVSAKGVTDSFTLQIADEGPGIEEKDKERIFKRFQQAKNNKAAIKGTGLGLTITKGIIEAHHGKIWVENSKEGAVFSFTLPYGKGGGSLAKTLHS